ncbi:MAG: RIO1 family regulatory kinase/ATPase [archaeon]
MESLEKRLSGFLSSKRLRQERKLAKGWSSEVWLCSGARGKKSALKIEKDKSPRLAMAERETENLKLANSIGVGPKLLGFDLKRRCVQLEFVEGKTLSKWVFECKSKVKLRKMLDTLFAQAKKLDEIGLSHGQLGGKGKNVLVTRSGKPVIIDFEKASSARGARNANQLRAMLFLNPNSALAKKVKEILGENSAEWL